MMTGVLVAPNTMPARRAAGKHVKPREVAMPLPHLIDMNPRPIMLGRWRRTLRHNFATVPKMKRGASLDREFLNFMVHHIGDTCSRDVKYFSCGGMRQ